MFINITEDYVDHYTIEDNNAIIDFEVFEAQSYRKNQGNSVIVLWVPHRWNRRGL